MKAPKVTRKSLEKHLAAHYDVGTLRSYRKVEKGFANSLYVVHTAVGAFIFKIAVRNNAPRIRYEIGLLNRLRGLPVPRPVMTKRRGYLPMYRGHYSFLYPFLPGAQRKVFTGRMLSDVGSFLGKMHVRTAGFRSSFDRTEFYTMSPRLFEKMIAASLEKLTDRKIRKALAYLEANMMRYALPKGLPAGAIHADLKPENVLFRRGLTGVVDFDNSYCGPLVFDLAHTISWFCESSGRFSQRDARRIFRAYERERPLTSRERKNFADAVHYAFLIHVLVDIYYLALHTLPRSYIIWGIDHLIEAERHLPPQFPFVTEA